MFSLINTNNVNDYNFDNLKDYDILYIKIDALYSFSTMPNIL